MPTIFALCKLNQAKNGHFEAFPRSIIQNPHFRGQKKYSQVSFAQYEAITKKLIDFVQCDCAIFPSKNVFVNYPNGQTALFNQFGEMKWNGTLNYNDSPCSSCAIDGDYFWSCCRDENCVIRYSADSINVDIRIGSKESTTFNKPIFASADEKGVYICCEDGRVRMINKSTLDVIDIASNVPNLKRFYKFGRFSIICASSGAYIEKD